MSSIIIAVLITFFVIYVFDIVEDGSRDSSLPPKNKQKEEEEEKRDSVDFDGDGF